MAFDRNLIPDPVPYFEGQGLRLAGRGKWRSSECRFHGGSDSMRINLASGAWVCMNCNVKGGDILAFHMQLHNMEFVDAAKALGAWVDDGKPLQHQKPAPLPPRAALQVLAFEANLAAVAAGNVANGVRLSELDLARVLAASNRISRLVEAYQ